MKLIRSLGLVAFLFFLTKGLVWIAIFTGAWFWASKATG